MARPGALGEQLLLRPPGPLDVRDHLIGILAPAAPAMSKARARRSGTKAGVPSGIARPAPARRWGCLPGICSVSRSPYDKTGPLARSGPAAVGLDAPRRRWEIYRLPAPAASQTGGRGSAPPPGTGWGGAEEPLTSFSRARRFASTSASASHSPGAARDRSPLGWRRGCEDS